MVATLVQKQDTAAAAARALKDASLQEEDAASSTAPSSSEVMEPEFTDDEERSGRLTMAALCRVAGESYSDAPPLGWDEGVPADIFATEPNWASHVAATLVTE